METEYKEGKLSVVNINDKIFDIYRRDKKSGLMTIEELTKKGIRELTVFNWLCIN